VFPNEVALVFRQVAYVLEQRCSLFQGHTRLFRMSMAFLIAIEPQNYEKSPRLPRNRGENVCPSALFRSKIQSSPAKSLLELYAGVEGEEMKRYM
jgi:hypothetical protein